MGSLVDAVPDSVESRSTTAPSGILEGALSPLPGPVVIALGLGSDTNSAVNEPPARRNPDDASRRSPASDGNQNDSGKILSKLSYPFPLTIFLFSLRCRAGIDEQVQATFS